MAAMVDMSVDSMIQNHRGMRVRGGGRGMGLRGVRGPGGTFGGVRGSHGHHCRGPLGLRPAKGPGGIVGGVRRSHGHPCRGPLGSRGVGGPGGTFRGVRKLDGHHVRGSLGHRGVRGPEGTFKGASGLDGHPCRGPLGLRAVRGAFRGAGGLDGPPRRGPLGMHATIKSMHKNRNLPEQDGVLEDRFKAAGSSGEESGTKLLVSNLNAGVSNEDIRALFSEIGELIRYGVHYDQDGSPSGSAEIVFAQNRDAFQAIKRYNNADLNGKAMKIEKVGSIVRPHVARLNMIRGAHGRRTHRMRPGPGYTQDVAAHNNGAGSSSQRGHGGLSDGVPIHGRGCGGGRRGRHGGLGGRPVEKSAEELDKELENYEAGTNEAGTNEAGTSQT